MTSNPWDDFIRRAKEYKATGQLESEQIQPKVWIGQRLAAVREAVLNSSDDWADQVKTVISNRFIHSNTVKEFHNWVDESPDNALAALRALWTRDNVPVAKRIRDFVNLFPHKVTYGEGTRARVASVLLMGLGASQHPPFAQTVFNKAYDQTPVPQT